MSKFPKKVVLLALGMTLLLLNSRAAIYTFTAIDEGWYDNTGFNIPSNHNYSVGHTPQNFLHRVFFVFDLSSVPTGSIASASLSLHNPKSGEAPGDGYLSSNSSELLEVGSVATALVALTNGTGGSDAFDALGGGMLWGSRVVSAVDNGTDVMLDLNSDFISTATPLLGNGSLAIGGWLQSDTNYTTGSIFAWTHYTVVQKPPQLVLNFVAAPAAVQLVNLVCSGNHFQFSFASQSGFTNAIQYRTNLIAGSYWQTYTNVFGDGTFKTIQIPLPIFSPVQQGFVRVITQ